MHRALIPCWILICVFISGCEKDLHTEFPNIESPELVDVADFRMVTYNIHGGTGPNGEGNFNDNLNAFKQLLQGESILCFQEVVPDCWNQLKTIFSDYPYRYFLPQESTKFGTHMAGGNAIFSKLPIVAFDQHLIQIDPGGDKWQRKAQYVRIFIGHNQQYLNLFHYHNTYNWHNNDSQSEKAGFEKFMAFVESKAIAQSEMTVLAGDFNISKTQVEQILSVSIYPHSHSNWVDHIYTNEPILSKGVYDTSGLLLSDHNAVWSDLCNLDC